MFESFFPKPRIFFITLVIWTGVAIALWYSYGQNLGSALGFTFREDASTVIGLGHFITPEFLWFDLYYLLVTAIFAACWFSYSLKIRSFKVFRFSLPLPVYLKVNKLRMGSVTISMPESSPSFCLSFKDHLI